MAIIATPQMFAVLSLADPEKLGIALAQKYPGDYFVLSSNQWILVAPGTAKEVCDSLGITEGAVGSAVVVAFSGYYGRANPQIWEWIASRTRAVARA